jgi:hypothetical protein
MQDPKQEEAPHRTRLEIFVRYVFFIFLLCTFYYVTPDKTQPFVREEYTPNLELIDADHYHPRRCTPVTSPKYAKFAELLIALAQEQSFPVLTAAHVGDKHCLLVTKLLNDEGRYDVLINPTVLSMEGPHFVKIKSILCRRTTQRKKLYTRLRFTYQNFTEPRMDFSISCPDTECTGQLVQAFEILNGTFRCS